MGERRLLRDNRSTLKLNNKMETLRTAINLIKDERKRQLEKEGYTYQHDATHTNGEIALAAACYALPSSHQYISDPRGDVNVIDALFPWNPEFFKPSEDRIRDLVKAGALIVAEIERLSIEKEYGGKKFNVYTNLFFGGTAVVAENLDYLEAKRIESITPVEDPYEHCYINEVSPVDKKEAKQ